MHAGAPGYPRLGLGNVLTGVLEHLGRGRGCWEGNCGDRKAFERKVGDANGKKKMKRCENEGFGRSLKDFDQRKLRIDVRNIAAFGSGRGCDLQSPSGN